MSHNNGYFPPYMDNKNQIDSNKIQNNREDNFLMFSHQYFQPQQSNVPLIVPPSIQPKQNFNQNITNTFNTPSGATTIQSQPLHMPYQSVDHLLQQQNQQVNQDPIQPPEPRMPPMPQQTQWGQQPYVQQQQQQQRYFPTQYYNTSSTNISQQNIQYNQPKPEIKGSQSHLSDWYFMAENPSVGSSNYGMGNPYQDSFYYAGEQSKSQQKFVDKHNSSHDFFYSKPQEKPQVEKQEPQKEVIPPDFEITNLQYIQQMKSQGKNQQQNSDPKLEAPIVPPPIIPVQDQQQTMEPEEDEDYKQQFGSFTNQQDQEEFNLLKAIKMDAQKSIIIKEEKKLDIPAYKDWENYRVMLSEVCQKILKTQFRFEVEQQGSESYVKTHLKEFTEEYKHRNMMIAKNHVCYQMMCKLKEHGVDIPEFASVKETMSIPEIRKHNRDLQDVELYKPSENSLLKMTYEAMQPTWYIVQKRELDEGVEKIENFLIQFDSELAAKSVDYIELKMLLDEFFRHSQLLSKFNFHSVFPIGLYNFNAITKENPHVQLSANYSVQSADKYDYKFISHYFKQIFEKILKPDPAENDDGEKVKRIIVNDKEQTIKIYHKDFNKKYYLDIKIEPFIDTYSDYVHHYIWLQEIIKSRNSETNHQIYITIRLLNYILDKYELKIPQEIIHFIYYYVSFNFQFTKIHKNLMNIFKFVSLGGFNEMLYSKKNLCKIDKLHLRILQRISKSDKKECEEKFKEFFYYQKLQEIFEN